MKTHHRVIILHLDEFHLLQLLDAALHLGGLGGLGAETINKFLSFGNFPLLRLGLAQQNLLARLALFQIEGEIARIFLRPAVVKGDSAGHQVIQQRHIVADNADSPAIRAQALLQPALALQIQVVGRFVQKQHLRLLQQQLRQCYAHLPTAGKLTAIAREILISKAQTAQNRLRARTQARSVAVLQDQLQTANLLQRILVLRRGGIHLLQVGRELIHHLLQLHDIAHAAQHLIQQRGTGNMNTILRQIAHLGMLRQHHLAPVGLHGAHYAFHQGRFTRPVLPGKGYAVPLLHHKRERIEQHTRAEFNMQVLNSKNHEPGVYRKRRHHYSQGACVLCKSVTF